MWKGFGWAACMGRVGNEMAADMQQIAELGVAEKTQDGKGRD